MPKRRRKRMRVWPVVLVAIALIAAALFGMWMGGGRSRDGAERAPAITPQATPEATAANAAPALEENLGAAVTPTPAPTEPGVSIPGWASIQLPAGSLEADVALSNPVENADWYYLTFSLRVAETGEEIFATGLIPPGETCNRVTLARELEPGEYPCVMHVQPYRMRDNSPTNNADMDILLIVG